MSGKFESKQVAREWVWETLSAEEVARFPYPIVDRIPNFAGAQSAAERLLDHALFEQADRIKVNPDSPQKHVRRAALKAGLVVYVPTPRLKGGFMKFDPSVIPREHYRDASMISRWDDWAEPVSLRELPQLDVVVAGCVAVTTAGDRCGKGEGYADLEYGILRELGHDPIPCVTTVHPLQIVEHFPTEPHDLRLKAIFTPEQTFEIEDGGADPGGVDWSLLGEEDIQSMPVLQKLRNQS